MPNPFRSGVWPASLTGAAVLLTTLFCAATSTLAQESAPDPFIAAKQPLFGIADPRPDNVDTSARSIVLPAADGVPITVRLAWDGRSADLDLHVVTPQGREIAYYSTTDSTTGGRLRWDLIPSTSCVPNRPATDEYVDFTTPTAGTYIVKVAMYSSRGCAAYPINYTVEAIYGGQTGTYSGTYTAASQATGNAASEVLRFTYDPTQVTAPVVFSPVANCPGNQTYSIPHLTTTADSRGQVFTSAVAIANLNAASTATIRACAYTVSGSFIGGSQFTLSPGRRIFAINPGSTDIPNGITALRDFFQVSSLPANSDFHAVVRSDTNVIVEGGFVGNGGQFFLFANAAGIGGNIGQAHMGTLSSYPGLLFLGNPNALATTARVSFLKADGTVANATQAFDVPGYGRLRLDLGNLTDPTGAAIAISDYYSTRIDAGPAGQLGGWAATVVPVAGTSTVSIAPLQVIRAQPN